MGLLPGPQKNEQKCGKTLDRETLNPGSTVYFYDATHANALIQIKMLRHFHWFRCWNSFLEFSKI
jgi:hypothetical protein